MLDKHALIGIFHLVAVVPLFFWVSFQRAATAEWVYNLLLGLGILIGLYHGMKAIGRIAAASPLAYVNLIHVLLVAPLLIWIGYHGKKTGRPAYDMLLMATFAALGYHLYHLVVSVNTFVKPMESGAA